MERSDKTKEVANQATYRFSPGFVGGLSAPIGYPKVKFGTKRARGGFVSRYSAYEGRL
jgi:hypothetical protein